jgi:2'-hydroxyisoflavone reductase
MQGVHRNAQETPIMETTRRSFLQTAAVASASMTVGAARAAARPAPRPQVEPASTKLRLLILGGTGFLGPHTVEYALARGHTMTLFNRGKTNPQLFPNCEKLIGDRNTGDLAALEGGTWDAVIDTSGYVPAHVDATATMVADTAHQYVFISSCSVYADPSTPCAEDAPVVELDEETLAKVTTIRESIPYYGGMKAHCEKAAEKAMPGRVTNIRPGLIVGPRDRSDRFTYWPVRIDRGGEVLAPGGSSDPVQWIDVRDLGQWIIHCIENNVVGEYNAILPGGRYTMAEMLHGCKAVTSTPVHFTWADAKFLEAQNVGAWMNMPCWVPPEGEYAGFSLTPADKAVAAGLTFRPLAETARDTIAWHKAERPADYDFGANRGRGGMRREHEQEVLKALRERAKETKDPADS